MRQFIRRHRPLVVGVAAAVVLLSSIGLALLIGSTTHMVPGPSPGITPSATASLTPSTTAQPTPTATLGPSPTPTLAPTTTPTSSATTRPTATPAPTPTPTASRVLPASLRGVEWSALPTNQKIVALTFDAGSGDQGLAKILATLASKNVPGTFFLTGQFIVRYPGDAKAIAAVDMHSIGNHTVDHPYMTQLSDAQVRAEILGAEQSIVSVTGRDPWPLFRFPYGNADVRTINIANSLGYGSIRWTVDTLGWQGTRAVGGAAGGQTVASVTSRALGAARPGEIVLMHVGAAPDGTTLDADALGGIIDGLRARGYGFVAIWDFING